MFSHLLAEFISRAGTLTHFTKNSGFFCFFGFPDAPFVAMLKFISRAGKSAMRGLFPRDVKLNTLDKPVGLQSCNLQQLQGTQPLLLFGFESQRSLASSNFVSRATIFDAFQNHRAPHKNIEFASFSQFLQTLPILRQYLRNALF